MLHTKGALKTIPVIVTTVYYMTQKTVLLLTFVYLKPNIGKVSFTVDDGLFVEFCTHITLWFSGVSSFDIYKQGYTYFSLT